MNLKNLALFTVLLSACSSSDRTFGDAAGMGGSAGGAGTGGSGGSAAGSGSGGDASGGAAMTGGTGPTGGTGGASGSGGAGGTGGSSVPLAECAESRIESLGAQVAMGVTTTADGAFSLSCGAGRSDDVAFDWIVPERGYYAISTAGSTFDTALGLLPSDCTSAELACNDDQAPGLVHSEILRSFAAGEHVVLVVDGKDGGNGSFNLNVEPITCPNLDLSEQTLPATLTTLDGTDLHEGPCGGAARREKTLRWSAPSAGLYSVSAQSDQLAPALHVEAGPRCGGQLLGCNAGTAGGSPARVTRWLEAGEPISVIVDATSGAGTFSLDVERVADACPVRAFDPFNDTVMATLAAGSESLLTASCAPSEIIIQPGGVQTLPEHAYGVTISGRSFCTFVAESDQPVTLYVLEGNQCQGSEVSCAESTAMGTGQTVEVRLGDIAETEAHDYVIVVETADPFADAVNYTFYAFCALV